MDITKIDKNFANTFSFEGMKTYDVNQPPFSLHGLCRQEGELDYLFDKMSKYDAEEDEDDAQ